MFKKIILAIALLLAPFITVFAWFFSILPEPIDMDQLKSTQAENLAYLKQPRPENRGSILIIVTSTNQMGDSGKSTGYEFTELARPYWVFTVNGFNVDIASIKGGEPTAVFDNDDMREFDYAFLNDPVAMGKVKNSIPIVEVNHKKYSAIFFVGGKGAMFDFPNNPSVIDLVKNTYQSNKVVAGVCHGPAAFTQVKLDNGEHLVAGKKVTGFTNEEELFLIKNAREIFPFLLEDKLVENGGIFVGGETYLNNVSVDGHLITGQNPWSVWETSEAVIRALGFKPVERQLTPEENTVTLLQTFARHGYASASEEILRSSDITYDRWLIAMHILVAALKLNVVDGIQLLRIATNLAKIEQ